MKERVQVTLLGQVFMLRSDASPEEVRRVADFVHRLLDEVCMTGKTVDSLNAALLALLNVSQSYLQLQETHARAEQELAVRLERLTRKIEDAGSTGPGTGGTTSLFGDFR